DEVVELTSPATMQELIDSGEPGLAGVRSAVASARAFLKLKDLDLLAPLDPPAGNVVAMGRNYQKHAEETAAIEGRKPAPPTIFTKAITSLTEPFADIAIDPAISDKIDWEVELAMIIGKRGANIKRADAMKHVFGYTVLNDVTARDIQSDWGGQYFKGKSIDRTCPTGPWIVTADEVANPQALNLWLRVNGTVKQDGNTRDMIYPLDAIIEWVSKGMTLLPGAMIATGTPDGVGFARKPPEFLQVGDVMETEVEGIGLLRNRFVAAVGSGMPAGARSLS
ncbi:MAG TPA: fumarylacetoacetate hydrolase family protein, partial [Patescibacteria group bacterium]|nr:fumarylacetoacetate hydrolase family protein [Patescibacteria group bacterium]